MTSFLGMDIQAVRTLATQLNSAHTDIDTTANSLNSALESAQWVGPDAQNFRSEWQTHFTNLKQIAQALSDASTKAAQNADQQEQASNG